LKKPADSPSDRVEHGARVPVNPDAFTLPDPEPPPHPGAQAAEFNSLAKKGIRLLLGRQVILQVLTFAGSVVLARMLAPADFGLYAIATFVVGAVSIFGEFGLSASLIQRKAELDERDLQVGFTLQQLLTSAVVLVVFLLAPWLAALYPSAPPETVWLVRVLAFSLYLTSWRTMSALQLERHLRYERLARIEILETLSYQGVAVALAVAGFGVWSFIWATLARGLLGTVTTFCSAPWRVRLSFDRTVAASLLRYGIPFQIQTLGNALAGWVTPLMIGRLLGPAAVGYVTWASTNGRKPLVLVESVIRVAFPHFARIQEDRPQVERVLSRYLCALLLPSGLWFVMLLIAGTPLVRLVYTSKWVEAVPCLVIFAAAIGLDVVGWVTGVTLNSLGLINHTTRVVTIRSLCNLLLAIPLIYWFGYVGAAVAYLVAQAATVPFLFTALGPGALVRVISPLKWIAVPCLGSAAAGYLMQQVPLPLLAHTCSWASLASRGWRLLPGSKTFASSASPAPASNRRSVRQFV
jgi:O-antigen/teichoic acid export membrane protein